VIYRVQTKNPIPWGESSIRQSREADRFIAFVGADSQSQGRISLQVFFFPSSSSFFITKISGEKYARQW
jgi:hypothetical protein